MPVTVSLLVRVRAAGINPGEAKIRQGDMHAMFPATFPSGQGSDLAGVVEEVGDGVPGIAVGDEVIGFTDNRASQAEMVVIEAENATIVDFAAVQAHGVKSEGNAVGASARVLAELASLIAADELEIPIAATYPLAQVRDAYRELADNHTRGKIVLHASS